MVEYFNFLNKFVYIEGAGPFIILYLFFSYFKNFVLKIKIKILLNYGIFIFFTFIIWYLIYPSFVDVYESSAVLDALNLKNNLNLYNFKEYFSGSAYGPLGYLILSIILIEGKFIILSYKIFNVLLLIISLILFLKVSKTILSKLYIFILFPMKFAIISVWDPLLYFLLSLSLYINSRFSPKKSIMLSSILAGLASSIKIHGCLYIGITILIFHDFKFVIKQTHIIILLCLFSFLLPFVYKNISFIDYIYGLSMFGAHSFILKEFIYRIFYTLIFILPFIYLVSWENYQIKIIKIVLILISIILIALASSKIGSTYNHLLFIILMIPIYFEYNNYTDLQSKKTSVIKNTLISFIILIVSMEFFKLNHFFYSRYNEASNYYEESINFLEKYNNLKAGVSNENGYEFYMIAAPILYKKSNQQINFPNYRDYFKAGVNTDKFNLALEDCKFNYFIFPNKKKPFSFKSWNNEEIYTEGIRKIFKKKYSLFFENNISKIYKCNL